jgi:hypothetical protein
LCGSRTSPDVIWKAGAGGPPARAASVASAPPTWPRPRTATRMVRWGTESWAVCCARGSWATVVVMSSHRARRCARMVADAERRERRRYGSSEELQRPVGLPRLLSLPVHRAGSSTWALAKGAWLLWRRRACSLSHSG